MFFSLTPASHSGSDGQYTASPQAVPAKPPPDEPTVPVPLQDTPRPPEQTAPIPEHQTEVRSESYQIEPVAAPAVPEVSPSAINTDVRRRGINPFLTGVTVGIVAFIIAFLICFAYLVVAYLRYKDG